MSVYDVLTGAFGKVPAHEIEVRRWIIEAEPRVVARARPYQVMLATWSRYWSQYAYQFGHELTHILTDYDRFSPHRHKWFEETVCEAASLFALERI